MQGKRRNKGVPYRILMLAGAFFFANPVVGIVDILPDAVGAALIALGVLLLLTTRRHAPSLTLTQFSPHSTPSER